MPTKRILMIDDDETIQAVVRFGIKIAAGWDVLTAGSGAEGIQTAQLEQPDVILLDIMMHDMDGIATLKALQTHAETGQIPVILLTANAQTAKKSQFNDLGVNGLITKPFNSLNLPEQIARILHWVTF